MIYYQTPRDCPNRALLETMTREEAAMWAAKAPSHVSEVSRRAEVSTFFGMSRAEEDVLFRVAAARLST